MMSSSFYRLLCVACVLVCCACQKSTPIQVLSTTGMIGDVVKNIAGNTLHTHTMMAAGVDPHLYKPTHRDMMMLKEATLVLYNGLHLEGKMQDVLETQGTNQRKAIAVATAIPPQNIIHSKSFVSSKDPHIWHDIENWKAVSRHITAILSQTYPQHKALYQKNLTTYLAQLEEVDVWILKKMKQIPPKKRYLVTTHDAFSYYGRRYGLEVKTLLGISTQAEYGLRDMEEMISFVTQYQIPAIFLESSISSKAMEAIIEGCAARGVPVAIGGELLSDALGKDKTPQGSYIGMMRPQCTDDIRCASTVTPV